MNCPTCDRPMWQRDDHTLVCKEGHQVAIGAAGQPTARARVRRVIPATFAGATAGAATAVLVEIGAHLLS